MSLPSALHSPCPPSSARVLVAQLPPSGPSGDFREGSRNVPVCLTHLFCSVQTAKDTSPAGEPTARRSKPNESSLSSTVSRGVSPVALACRRWLTCSFPEVSREFPALITCPTVSGCFVVTLAETITSAFLESLLESLLEFLLVLMECTLQPHDLHMYYST